MALLHLFAQYALHIDVYLVALVKENALLAYGVLFLIIFAETGLVITPFLPGDSLIFAAGSIASHDLQQALSFKLLFLLLVFASIAGNKLNYLLGRLIGPQVFAGRFWLNQRHLNEAHAFYEKHGGKTIIFARFLPVIRTFVPFVAGISAMQASTFTFYNILSAVLWVGCILTIGYFFGGLPFVQAHFTLFIYGIIFVSLLPALITCLYKRSQKTA